MASNPLLFLQPHNDGNGADTMLPIAVSMGLPLLGAYQHPMGLVEEALIDYMVQSNPESLLVPYKVDARSGYLTTGSCSNVPFYPFQLAVMACRRARRTSVCNVERLHNNQLTVIYKLLRLNPAQITQ